LKTVLNSALTLVLFVASSGWLRAQEVGAYLGLGGAYASSNGVQIETFSDGNLYKTPSLTGVFSHAALDVLFSKHIGVGADISWRFSHDDYAGIPYRPYFYNVDAIYRFSEFTTKGWFPEVRGGLGGARLRFTPSDDQSCAQVPGCQQTNHFQQHLAIAARWYWTDHVFIRPAFDLHHVNNFDEFGSNWVPQYSVGVGYSVGKRDR
jgi:hypothetical protein